MKRYIIAALAALTVILVAPSLASASDGMRKCSGSGWHAVYAGPATSCGMAKATRDTVKRATNGEVPFSVNVKSPVTGKRYYMFNSGKVRRGKTMYSRYRAAGAAGFDIRADFWTP